MHTKPVTPSSFAETTVEEPIEPSRGTLIDRFLVLEQLGAGGMGVVYAAHDPELDRKVALKLLLPRVSAAGYGDQTRLLREAQALAKLSHPNVVAVHDVGTRGDRVWIAMEFVSGQTLTAWARERPRRWPELLAVLADVARGMAAAHEAGLVHRDIKPDNVMIGQDGRVRVMDFGLAHGRATGSTEPDLTATLESGHLTAPLALRLTAQGAVQGTPAYMAPEQWLGHDEQPATDQFGWSVMAWELLYGERPFAGATNIAIATAVLAGQRRPPPRGRSVPSWLRRVLERGLATDPTQRWPSMAALLSALDRGKTRARVRLAATALAGVAAIAAGTEAYHRWDVAQRVATCAAAGAVIDHTWNDDARQRLRDAFRATGVSYAATSAEKVMPWLDKRATEWKRARADICLNATVRGIWNRDLWERATWCIEDRLLEFESLVDEFGRADANVTERSLSAVTNLRTDDVCLKEGSLVLEQIPVENARSAINTVRRMIARTESLALSGRSADAHMSIIRAREQAEMLKWPPTIAAARTSEGLLHSQFGNRELADTTLRKAYFEAGESGAWEVAARAAAELMTLVGYEQSRHQEGLEWGRHAEVALSHSADRAAMTRVKILTGFSRVYYRQGDYKAAITHSNNALRILEEELGPHHPTTARALTINAAILSALGETSKSQTSLERALSIQESTLGSEHPAIIATINNLAGIHLQTGNPNDALPLLERALSLTETKLGANHPDLALLLLNLGAVKVRLGMLAEAKSLYWRALTIQTSTSGPNSIESASTLNNLANLVGELGDESEALSLHTRALSIRKQLLPPNHLDIAQSLCNVASTQIELGENAFARTSALQALAIYKTSVGPTHTRFADCLTTLATIEYNASRYKDALSLFEKAVAIYESLAGDQVKEPRAHFGLAKSLVRTGGDDARAIVEARRARDGYRAAGARAAKWLAEVEQWLTEHDSLQPITPGEQQ